MEVTFSNNDYLVEVTYNDNPVILGGCTASPCKATDFVAYLQTLMKGFTTVADTCSAAMAVSDKQSKFLVQ
jgi:hypothetical protein